MRIYIFLVKRALPTFVHILLDFIILTPAPAPLLNGFLHVPCPVLVRIWRRVLPRSYANDLCIFRDEYARTACSFIYAVLIFVFSRVSQISVLFEDFAAKIIKQFSFASALSSSKIINSFFMTLVARERTLSFPIMPPKLFHANYNYNNTKAPPINTISLRCLLY